jgi:hypothetical protein
MSLQLVKPKIALVGKAGSAVALAAVLAAVTGCQAPPAEAVPQAGHLKTLGMLFGKFSAYHHGQPPADEAQFKKYIASLEPGERETFGVKSVDDVFISPRDGQPYVVRYGVRGSQFTESGVPIVAHEKTGVNGRYLTVTFMGDVNEVDEAQLHDLTAAPAL